MRFLEQLSSAFLFFLLSSGNILFALGSNAVTNRNTLRGLAGSNDKSSPSLEKTSSANEISSSRRRRSSCNQSSTPESCRSSIDQHTQESCIWCECDAVPSECVSHSQALKLPEGVFTCEGVDQNDADTNAVSSFSFKDGLTHQLSEDEVDPNLCDPSSPLSLSGYMDITGSMFDSHGEGKHLFYWFFEKRGSEIATDTKIPFILWLTGGPGCSSSLALLTENGPCKVNEAGDKTVYNPDSWIESAHMLWLDQPAGVGFSYGEATDKNERMVSEDVYYFLQAFFQSHPEYVENPLFVVGESYGGHYAPAIAHRVFIGNQQKKEGTELLNLKGLAVGNGLTDPKIQYQYYPEMAFKNSHNIQTVSEETYVTMRMAVPECIQKITACNEAKTQLEANFLCQRAYYFCESKVADPYFETGLNPYDIRLECGDHPLCYDFSNVMKFLNMDSTREALHVSSKSSKWITCNDSINAKFVVDEMENFAPDVADLLNAGIPVLIYAGDVDFICNYLGNKAWTLDLDWEFQKEFEEAKDHDWGDKSGLARSSHGLTFLQVYDAGHMVPTDQPEVALKMITEFISGGKF